MTLKNGIHSFPAWARHLGKVVENKPVVCLWQVRLLCLWARHLTRRFHLYVEDRWPSFPYEERVGGRKGIRPQKQKCHVTKCRLPAVATPKQEKAERK